MTLYFVESKNKQPQLFCFSHVFNDDFIDIDFINSFQEDFDQRKENCFLKYWTLEGEDLILQAWNEKYKKYLKDEKKNEETSCSPISSNNSVVTAQSKELLENVEEHNVNAFDEVTELYTWDELWEQHRQEIYAEQYMIFATIFYNYFLHIKNSFCEISNPEGDEDNSDYENYQLEIENKQLIEELEQLKLLGLPTYFRGRPQLSSRKSKKHTSNNIHFSDFFSDSDFEEDSSESTMEENSDFGKEENIEKLHKIEDNALRKMEKKSKKKNRKLKNVPSFILEEKGLLKYWRKRFSLFSRFDDGIRLDRESWFSVTPEKVAKHLADRLKCSILVDGFCGSGGNAIQFAHTCERVIAIDIDPVKLEMAKHNANIYNVGHKIEFILGDFLQIASSGRLKADIVFLSPPWGGPKYKNKKDYDIEKYLLPVNATELVAVSRIISENVALFLPRNSNVKQIIKLAGVGNRCEIEHNYLDSRLVAVTALYGEDILKSRTSDM